ncbi:MAG: hypothetical protein LBI42_06050 [Chitinispirillales bacterium]|nr:hypothetical protein [Chitinispirillales bacterium]
MFPRPDGSGMVGKGEYYRFVWDSIWINAGVSDIQFYDLRHHAVAWMRSQGIEDWRIVSAAGWSGMDMITDYDPDNTHLIEHYDRTRVAKCSTNCST